ncbi:MAG: arginyltransferase [Pseudomonadota bacterium]
MDLEDDFLSFLEETYFFKTKPSPCPYLPNREETKILTWLKGANAEKTHSALLEMGFRRSQTAIYKPNCKGCSACVPLRVDVRLFKPSKSQKRIRNRNRHLFRRVTSPTLSEKHYNLYQKYMQARHPGEDMGNMDFRDVAMMVAETTIDTSIVEYYEIGADGEDVLVGWCLTDYVDHGISMVYSVFDPDHHSRSPGVFAIMDHVALARELEFQYLYLGYWVKGSQKMAYKNLFNPHEIYRNGHWVRVSTE